MATAAMPLSAAASDAVAGGASKRKASATDGTLVTTISAATASTAINQNARLGRSRTEAIESEALVRPGRPGMLRSGLTQLSDPYYHPRVQPPL